jgi:hypothetical protein
MYIKFPKLLFFSGVWEPIWGNADVIQLVKQSIAVQAVVTYMLNINVNILTTLLIHVFVVYKFIIIIIIIIIIISYHPSAG